MISVGNEKVVRLSNDLEISHGYVGETEVFPNKPLPTIQSEWVDTKMANWSNGKNHVGFNGENGLEKVTVIPTVTDGYRLTSCAYFASGCKNLNTVEWFDASNVTNAQCMYRYCHNLTSVPALDYSKVTNASSMFEQCHSLVKIENLNTPNLRNIKGMFGSCRSLIEPPELIADNVTDMTSLFSNCTSLLKCPLVDTKNVDKMDHMFESCYSLTYVPDYDLSSCRSAIRMFYDCVKLIALPKLNLSNLENGEQMFTKCNSKHDLYEFDANSLVNAIGMFEQCGNIFNYVVNNCDKLKHIYKMFRNNHNVKTITFNATEIHPIGNMSYCFTLCYNLTDVNGIIDCSDVTNLEGVFYNANSLINVKLKNVNCDISFASCKQLSLSSLEYLIHNLKTVTIEENRIIILPLNIITSTPIELFEEANSKNWTISSP